MNSRRSASNPLQAAKPRPAVRRSSGTSAPTTGNSSAATSNDDAAAATPSRANSKLRANRDRRRRERSMDEDDLDLKFSNLSVSAPTFTPAAMRSPSSPSTAPPSTSSVAAPTASWLAKAKPPQRRVPPAHQRQQQQQQQSQLQKPTTVQPPTPVPKAPTPMSQWSASTAAAAAAGTNSRTPSIVVATTGSSTPTPAAAIPSSESVRIERRPRRQRIGTMGFARTGLSTPRRPSQSACGSSAFANASSTSAFQLGSGSSTPSTPTADATTQRKRSDSADYSSDSDEEDVFPDDAAPATAFPERLMLLSQQRKVPMSVVSRDAVIHTVFTALFASKQHDANKPRRFSSAFGDDTSGTETDEPNEDFVKRGLAASLFKDSLQGLAIQFHQGGMRGEDAVEHFLTPPFIHTLVNDMRFEDFRTASARIDILRAIHKSCPSKRIHIARALVDAATLRLQYVKAVTHTAQALEIEKNKVMTKHAHDHSNGFVDLLRYAIEHVGESLNGITGASANAKISQREVDEIVRNYLAALVVLWKTHWLDPAGSDDEELISCAGQFVAYLPHVALELLQRLVRHWPSRYPPMEVVAIRMIARVIMTSPPLHTLDPSPRLPIQIFTRLAKCVQSTHTQVAQEALAFTGCQFAMVHFLGQYDEIYAVVSDAFHRNARRHWNETIRTTSDSHFDRALDYAP